MAQNSLPKRSSKLNLSRRQIALFQKVILIGSQMAGVINASSHHFDLPKSATRYAQEWSELMVQLANALL